MGKHRGSSNDSAGTEAGPAFKDLTPEEKGAEFDRSHSNPECYAQRNFGATPGTRAERQARQG